LKITTELELEENRVITLNCY